MKGEEVIVGALRQQADRWYAVPGYPVTTIAQQVGAEVTVNEKVALEYALGDSLAGRRAAVILKNVGLNACADPLVNATTQGLRAGVVILVGDDLDVRGSQNAQDSRYYGEVAQVPVIELDRETIAQGVAAAFEVSEKSSRVAIVRFTPSLLEEEVEDQEGIRSDQSGTLAGANLTMKGRVIQADHLLRQLFSWSQLSPLNRLRGGTIGVGMAHGTSHLVTVYPPPPLPRGATINELGRPFVREHLALSPPAERRVPETLQMRRHFRTLCPHCPFRTLFTLMKEREMRAACDMGCAILAMNPPFQIGICGYGLGSSVAVGARSTGIALCGDYALLHSGINALFDVYEKRLPLLCIIMKNQRLGMVGNVEAWDPVPYLAWAHPTVCKAEDRASLERVLVPVQEPTTVVVEGVCPEGESHETMEY